MNESSERLPTPFDDGEVYDLILKDIPYGFDFYTGLAHEAEAVEPNLIDLYTAREGDTWQSIAQRAGKGLVSASR